MSLSMREHFAENHGFRLAHAACGGESFHNNYGILLNKQKSIQMFVCVGMCVVRYIKGVFYEQLQ